MREAFQTPLTIQSPDAVTSTMERGQLFYPRVRSPSKRLALGGSVASLPEAEIAQVEVLINPKATARENSFKALESWVGRVIEVDAVNNKFTAIVSSDVHMKTNESAEFTFDEISEDDATLVEPGAIFYWSVGYQVNEFGRRSTNSVIRFRRIRHWTRKELEKAKVRAESYADWFVGGTNGTIDTATTG